MRLNLSLRHVPYITLPEQTLIKGLFVYSCRHICENNYRKICPALSLLRWSDIQGQRLYRGQNSNLCKCCLKQKQYILLLIRIQKIYSLTLLQCINHELLAKRSKVSILLKKICTRSELIWSQKNSFDYISCFVVIVTQQNSLVAIESH